MSQTAAFIWLIRSTIFFVSHSVRSVSEREYVRVLNEVFVGLDLVYLFLVPPVLLFSQKKELKGAVISEPCVQKVQHIWHRVMLPQYCLAVVCVRRNMTRV